MPIEVRTAHEADGEEYTYVNYVSNVPLTFVVKDNQQVTLAPPIRVNLLRIDTEVLQSGNPDLYDLVTGLTTWQEFEAAVAEQEDDDEVPETVDVSQHDYRRYASQHNLTEHLRTGHPATQPLPKGADYVEMAQIHRREHGESTAKTVDVAVTPQQIRKVVRETMDELVYGKPKTAEVIQPGSVAEHEATPWHLLLGKELRDHLEDWHNMDPQARMTDEERGREHANLHPQVVVPETPEVAKHPLVVWEAKENTVYHLTHVHGLSEGVREFTHPVLLGMHQREHEAMAGSEAETTEVTEVDPPRNYRRDANLLAHLQTEHGLPGAARKSWSMERLAAWHRDVHEAADDPEPEVTFEQEEAAFLARVAEKKRLLLPALTQAYQQALALVALTGVPEPHTHEVAYPKEHVVATNWDSGEDLHDHLLEAHHFKMGTLGHDHYVDVHADLHGFVGTPGAEESNEQEVTPTEPTPPDHPYVVFPSAYPLRQHLTVEHKANVGQFLDASLVQLHESWHQRSNRERHEEQPYHDVNVGLPTHMRIWHSITSSRRGLSRADLVALHKGLHPAEEVITPSLPSNRPAWCFTKEQCLEIYFDSATAAIHCVMESGHDGYHRDYTGFGWSNIVED